jgi:hypothetical protein
MFIAVSNAGTIDRGFVSPFDVFRSKPSSPALAPSHSKLFAGGIVKTLNIGSTVIYIPIFYGYNEAPLAVDVPGVLGVSQLLSYEKRFGDPFAFDAIIIFGLHINDNNMHKTYNVQSFAELSRAEIADMRTLTESIPGVEIFCHEDNAIGFYTPAAHLHNNEYVVRSAQTNLLVLVKGKALMLGIAALGYCDDSFFKSIKDMALVWRDAILAANQ